MPSPTAAAAAISLSLDEKNDSNRIPSKSCENTHIWITNVEVITMQSHLERLETKSLG